MRPDHFWPPCILLLRCTACLVNAALTSRIAVACNTHASAGQAVANERPPETVRCVAHGSRSHGEALVNKCRHKKAGRTPAGSGGGGGSWDSW